jgi:hypothetical protein
MFAKWYIRSFGYYVHKMSYCYKTKYIICFSKYVFACKLLINSTDGLIKFASN